jgi:DNA-binding MarR family transcriptional regulator
MDANATARLLEQTARAVYDARGPNAVHPGQWAVLRYLEVAARQQRTIGGVARHLGVTHAPASRAVAALARKQLVAVAADPQDRRVRRIELTAAGRQMLDRDPGHRLAAAIAALDAATQRELAGALDAILQRLGGGGVSASARAPASARLKLARSG